MVLHGVCPDVAGKWPLVRQACLSTPEGSFADTTLEGMVDALVDAYASLCSRFEVAYSLASAAATAPDSSRAATVKLKISSDCGYGEAEIALELPTPPPAAAAPTPQPSKPEETPQPA